MKRNTVIGICLVMGCLLPILPFISNAAEKKANGELIDDIQEVTVVKQKAVSQCGYNRPLRVATFVSNPPFGWVEKNANHNKDDLQSYGASIRIFEEIAKKLNLKYVRIGFRSQERAISALKRGDLDLLVGAYTPNSLAGGNRGTIPVYPGFFQNVFTVYFPKDRQFLVTSFESLEGKKGIVRREENIYPLFSSNRTREMYLTIVNTAKVAFEKLMSGEADYLLGSPYSIEAELRRYKLHEKIVPADIILSDATMFFVLTTNTDCYKLRNILSDELTEYVKDEQHILDIIHEEIDQWGDRFREDEDESTSKMDNAQ